MRTNKLFTCFITACCACMQFSSCSQPDEKSITDTWVSDVNSYGDIFQFHFDGNGKGLACYMYLWHWWVYCPAPLYTPKYFKYKDHGNKIIIDYIIMTKKQMVLKTKMIQNIKNMILINMN